MYLHLPAQTAADFEEALRCLAVGAYSTQVLYREETLCDPQQIIDFSSQFAEGLKLSGATPDTSGIGWKLEGALVSVLIPCSQAQLLLELLQAFGNDKRVPTMLPDWPNVKDGLIETIAYVTEQLRLLLLLSAHQRSPERLSVVEIVGSAA